jgi:hypothetical protein
MGPLSFVGSPAPGCATSHNQDITNKFFHSGKLLFSPFDPASSVKKNLKLFSLLENRLSIIAHCKSPVEN